MHLDNSTFVMTVIGDFGHGEPRSALVLVGAERHPVRVARAPGGLLATCPCPNGCPARPQAIRAVRLMVEVWARPRRCAGAMETEADRRLDPRVEPDPQARDRRPYDGLARATCPADLVALPVPPWAYDPSGLRRPLRDAHLAADLWFELDRAVARALGAAPSAATRPRAAAYYAASWEPDRGMPAGGAYEVDLPADLDLNDTAGW